ncbi:hypothetical protein BpHYR1_001031 [Brachionus plicatilis]|uniref:Uncharacterized protein n=1 Tax=Brachionus plicatilis TaxID=10195 RepID=A0A3M7QAZ1_BRAPC|nr:hypothetical protein BpHYR1_001031 [Brachionus plicatilis]
MALIWEKQKIILKRETEEDQVHFVVPSEKIFETITKKNKFENYWKSNSKEKINFFKIEK